jgi:uncharacterized protein YbaP (TraB family)
MRAALLCLTVLGCSHPCPEYRLPPGPPQTFLWEATGPATVYLYGTYHVASRDEVPEVAWARLGASTAIILELPEDRPRKGSVEDLYRLPLGKTLDQLLPADAWYDLRDTVVPEVPEDALRRMRPWVAMGALRRAKYPQRQVSMDESILAEAKRRGLEILALEEWAEQLTMIDESFDVEELVNMINERDDIACHIGNRLAAYRAGDLETMTGGLDEVTADRILRQRNEKWIDHLDAMAREKRVAFVAVGLAHLAGPTGLPTLLEQKGYRVTRL